MWLSELKIAIVNNDINAIERLLKSFDVSKFQNLEQLNEAAALNLQATQLLKTKLEQTRQQIDKLQNVKKYIQS